MDVTLPQVPPEPQQQAKVCRMLRTKTAFGSFSGLHDADDDGGWQAGESTTAVYWCLGTMETAGPDDLYCHPSTCKSGRGCFLPELD